MRGKLVVVDMHRKRLGITPACAGKTRSKLLRGRGFRDHPRVCGENAEYNLAVAKDEGSPPRVRGKLFPDYAEPCPDGITPACAGKTKE